MAKTYDHAWQQVRRIVLHRDRYECQIRGPRCTQQATEADHIVALAKGGARLDLTNLRAACRPCNAAEGGRLGQARRQRTPSRNWFGDHKPAPNAPTERMVVLIVGPPGSGKSTKAVDLAHTHGLQHMEREQYGSDKAYRQAVERAAAHPHARLAVVRTCPTTTEQREWERLTVATETIVLDVDQATCTERIHARTRPQWRGEIAAVARWHQERQNVAMPSRSWL